MTTEKATAHSLGLTPAPSTALDQLCSQCKGYLVPVMKNQEEAVQGDQLSSSETIAVKRDSKCFGYPWNWAIQLFNKSYP